MVAVLVRSANNPSPRLRDSFGPPRIFCALALASMNQPIELAQTHQFVFEQPPQRIELNRIVLAQDFGGGGELNRIGPPGVVSEPGLNLFDFPPRPPERTTLAGDADHVLAASCACVCAHGCAAPGYARSKSRDSRAPSEATGRRPAAGGSRVSIAEAGRNGQLGKIAAGYHQALGRRFVQPNCCPVRLDTE